MVSWPLAGTHSLVKPTFPIPGYCFGQKTAYLIPPVGWIWTINKPGNQNGQIHFAFL
jgi:hypothetical protein